MSIKVSDDQNTVWVDGKDYLQDVRDVDVMTHMTHISNNTKKYMET